MNTKTIVTVYGLAVLQIAFAIVGFFTHWITTDQAIAILSLGLTTFGIHTSNVSLGKTVGSVRGY